ncbi:MAG: hypothetical protein MK538_07485 [Planctomycetes bacterium]|nr:hypothetical protein [Planctomycetota bacterium]
MSTSKFIEYFKATGVLVAQEARRRVVGEQLVVRLAGRAVVAFVFSVDDLLNG